jgi:hypothetical protein
MKHTLITAYPINAFDSVDILESQNKLKYESFRKMKTQSQDTSREIELKLFELMRLQTFLNLPK